MNIFLQNISQNILPYEEFNYDTKYLFITSCFYIFLFFQRCRTFFREFLLTENKGILQIKES